MKKLLAIILAAACAFSLAACAATPDTPNASAPPATEEQLDCIGDPTTQQLAAPVAVSMPQYPNEAKYTLKSTTRTGTRGGKAIRKKPQI